MSNKEVEIIRAFLKQQGFTDLELIDDLTDHLATEIECCMDNDQLNFEASFEKAKLKLLPNTPYQIERDLKFLTAQKHTSMIKKIAYIGGYLSALAMALAFLFIGLSYQNDIQVDKRLEIAQSDIMRAGIEAEGIDEETSSATIRELWMETGNLKMASLKQIEWAQSLMVTSILLFILTYLPYRFYDGYQKSVVELT